MNERFTLSQTGPENGESMLWGRCQMWATRALAVSCVLLAVLLSANIVLHLISETSEAGERVRYTVTEERVSGGELSLRRKREAGDQLKAEAENAIVRLMGEPGCREDCDRLRDQLEGLGSNIDLTMDRLAMLRAEIDRVSKSCGNRTSAEEVDSREVELAIGHHSRAGVELEEGRAADDRTIMDHDLAASAMDPVHRPPDGYPWPPAALTQHHTGSENGGRFPPTGPDSERPTGAESPTSSGIGPSADSGPGEDIKTSQQMTVSLPQQMERVCAMVPGPPGSSGYLCSPVRDLMGQQQISQGNFYLQVLKNRNSQTHVPTAISSPNPYAFPTLSGSPVIVPASAASPGQLMPVYNPKDGRIGLQNYPQTVTVVNSNHEPQFTPPQEGGQQYGSGVHYPGEQQSVSPVQQPDRPVPHPGGQQPPSSLPQKGFQQQYPFPQYIFAQYAPEQGYGSRPSVYPQQAYLPPPAQHQQDYLPPPPQQQPAYFPPPRPIFQQHYSPQPISPQVYIPQPGNQPSQDVLQCAYVIVPNSPVQTYKFPPVPGVSETLSRSDGNPMRKSNENLKTENPKPHVNKQLSVKDKNNPGENSTRANIKSSGMNCEAGMKSCSDGSKCVLIDMWCDSLIDCPDGSDEALCSCKQRIRPERYCDGYFDCPTGEDELGCSGCPEDMFSCGDANSLEPLEATCLPLEKRCDFVRHCKNGKDELNCNLITDVHDLSKVSIVSFTQGFLFRNWKGSWYPVCSAVSWALKACSAEIGRLTEIPKIRFEEIPDYSGLVANEFGNIVKLTPFCLDSKPAGTALWVTCPSPECGTKPRISSLSRKKRDTPQPPSNQYYSGQSPHQDEPSFQTSPEVMDFVKNFFNSVSVLDRKTFYKRLWGPLIQPYMGVTESPVDNQQTTKDTPRDIGDPSQLSWKKYLRPNLPAYNDYDPNNVFPNYQEDIQYEKLNPYPSVFNYYQTHPSNYEGNYRGSPFSQYQMPYTYQIPVNRMKRDDNLRVVGGSKSEAGAWPWVVVLYRDGVFHCGGTILTVDIILTAAHCVHDFEDHYYEVHAGLLRRLSFSPQNQIRVVDQVVAHENYNSKTMLSDVALMHLSQPLKFNRWVLPACLPPLEEAGKPSQPLPGTLCTAVGWGAMYEHGPDPDDLREVEVPVLPVCTHRIDQLGEDICAGYPEGGMDTCQGDSGGPLLCRSSEQKWYVAGIVSHGQGCARLGEPGVYTRVSLFRKWIQDHLTWESGSSRASQKLCPGLLCKSGQCLPKRFHCNNHIDCLEGEDELNCDKLLADLLVNKSRSVSGEKDSNNLPISNKSEVDAPSTHNFIAPENTAKRTYSEVTRRPTEKNILQTSNEGRKPTSLQPTPQPPTGEPTQLSGATTEEPFLHSHQAQSVDISSLFTCTTINQRIISSRICDSIVDCEDGSDESNCTCKDRLVHLAPDAICNGVTDCRDTSDEKDCKAKCSVSSFFCPKSRTCVPQPLRCNMEKDCYFGEDEEDCYALIKDDLEGMKQNNLTKLPLLLNGTAVVFSDGSWKHICVGTDPGALAARICTHLGFGIVREYNKLNISEDSGTSNTYYNCSHLQIRCSSPLKRSWLAPLFNSGLPQTLALLVSENWLLAPTAGIHFQGSKVYLNTWLGKRNLTLNVEGIYDQYIHIDGVTSIGDAQVTLLHLEQPAKINHQTVPLNFPDWPTPPNEKEKCEALALTDIGSLISISLRPISCREKMRCYNLIESEPSQCYITGIVVCHSSHGPYMTSIISEDICNTPLIEIPDLVLERKNILNHLEIGHYEKLAEEDCDTVRCETGECLDWARIGDGISDCFDSRDETRNLWEKKEGHCKLLGKDCSCKPGEIRCPKGRCISAKKFCDQRVDCDDGSDEEGCDCKGFLSLARPGQLCDGVHNCRDKADEDWNSCRNITDCTAPDMYPCHKSGGCIPSSFVCDGDADCPNSEDEEMCIAIRSPSHKRKEGLLYSRLHGQLVPQCHEADDELAAKICALQEGLKIKAAHSSIIPYTYVLTDAFSRVHLNSHTYVSLRSNRTFATIEQSFNNTCTAMYVECQ